MRNAALLGVQRGPAAIWWVSFTPSCASRSILGVLQNHKRFAVNRKLQNVIYRQLITFYHPHEGMNYCTLSFPWRFHFPDVFCLNAPKLWRVSSQICTRSRCTSRGWEFKLIVHKHESKGSVYWHQRGACKWCHLSLIPIDAAFRHFFEASFLFSLHFKKCSSRNFIWVGCPLQSQWTE